MEIKTKQRLIGGAVLLALLTVSAPLFLHHTHPSKQASLIKLMQKDTAQVAAQTDHTLTFQPVESQEVAASTPISTSTPQRQTAPKAVEPATSMTVKAQAPASSLLESRAEIQAQHVHQATMSQAAAALAGSTSVKATSLAPVNKALPQIKPVDAKEIVEHHKAHAVKKTMATMTLPQKRLHHASKQGEEWFVQMASFSDFQHAERFRLTLFHAQFPAVIEAVEVKHHRVYRVLLGPATTQKTAALLMRQVKREKGLHGYLTHHRG